MTYLQALLGIVVPLACRQFITNRDDFRLHLPPSSLEPLE